MESHKDLDVWKDAITLVGTIYTISSRFPADEKFGLVAQIRRAAISVPSNIAEGAARGSRRDFARFVAVARGSLAELETQLIIARQLHFADADHSIDSTIATLYKRLNALHRSLNDV